MNSCTVQGQQIILEVLEITKAVTEPWATQQLPEWRLPGTLPVALDNEAGLQLAVWLHHTYSTAQ